MIKQLSVLFLLIALVFTAIPVQAGSKQISDDIIYNNVLRKLATDPIVKGGALEVEVKEGSVTLKGQVDSEKRKDKAEKVAHKVQGVRSVDNQIKVVEK